MNRAPCQPKPEPTGGGGSASVPLAIFGLWPKTSASCDLQTTASQPQYQDWLAGRQPERPARSRSAFQRHGAGLFLFLALLLGGISQAHAQTSPSPSPSTLNLNIGLNGLDKPADVDSAIKIVAVMTMLTLAPSIILLMTCFTRIVIVLSFVRSALSLQGAPSNQIIIGLSLFLTFFIMAPVWERIDHEALEPYRAGAITSDVALDKASVPIRSFMLKQARPKDVELFVALAKIGPTSADQLPLKVVIPGFIISELRTAFQMGFLLFLPFILIDLVVATVLMSMGMMMMPPMTISLPLKILLFVLVDGWHLIVSSIVQSFAT
jgi:flagellar biosynthetic protein FliP